MRSRLEREQGAISPLKAGPGGYYDIDFALMYLRLKSAGIFYKVLNTPERIDIIEKMGHLERSDAAFLRGGRHVLSRDRSRVACLLRPCRRTAAEFAGSSGDVNRLVNRWTPERLHDEPLPQTLAQIQARTREYFRRLFG